MSTATQQVRQQTQEEIYRELAIWEQTLKPANLCEDQHNLKLIQDYIVKVYAGFINRTVLANAVEALRPQLHFIAQPEASKPTPVKKGDMFQRLAEVGVLKSPHMSHQEVEDQRTQLRNKEQAFLDRAHLLKEQSLLQQEKLEAETVTVQHRLGRVDHYRTGEARKAAKAKVAAKIENFNARCIATGNDNLQVTPPTI